MEKALIEKIRNTNELKEVAAFYYKNCGITLLEAIEKSNFQKNAASILVATKIVTEKMNLPDLFVARAQLFIINCCVDVGCYKFFDELSTTEEEINEVIELIFDERSELSLTMGEDNRKKFIKQKGVIKETIIKNSIKYQWLLKKK